MSEAPVGQAPVGQAPVGQAPVGQAPVGQAPVGQAPVGQAPASQAPASQTVESWSPDGDPKPNEDAIIAAIGTVYDPEIPVNIYELGLIYTIEIDDQNAVKVEMTLTAPGCPSAQELPVMVQDAIMAVPGVASCQVDTVWDPPWDPSRMTEDARLSLNMF